MQTLFQVMQRESSLRNIVLVGIILFRTFAPAQDLAERPVPDLQISLADRLNVFNKTWETVNKHFFDAKFNGVDWAQMKVRYQPLVEAATDKPQLRDLLARMVNELHVSHMGVNQGFSYNYGVALTQIEEKWLVSAIAQDSAAQREGMKPGWILTFAEGDCLGLKRRVSVRMVDSKDQTRSLELPCGSYTFPSEPGSVQLLEGGAVYLRFSSFTLAPGKWLADQVSRNRSAAAIVLDLRGNGGGSLAEQLKVFDLFFSQKTVIGKFRDRKGKEYTLKTGGNKSAYQDRIFVLTDHSTQSAAEVFAQAIQETGRGIVIGQRTQGGVLLGTHYKLPNRFDLHVALMDYHTAKGIRLEGRGVIPDVVVDLTVKDFRENKDAVLDRVRQMLQQP
jgi:carboxyl-terminal processing protease